MTAAPWNERLRVAATEEEVVELANHYVRSLESFEVAMLPARCRPRAMLCAHDVSTYAFELLGHYCEASDASARLVQGLAVFFTAAATRLSEIVSDTNVREAGARRPA
jgi:hypothetical protein